MILTPLDAKLACLGMALVDFGFLGLCIAGTYRRFKKH